jgi:hypothetical protein
MSGVVVLLHLNWFFRTFGAASNQQNTKQPMPINNLETHWQKPRGGLFVAGLNH